MSTPRLADDDDGATYDDELLDAHFIAGDGRVNENIGLTTVHHIFHSEHNRLVGESTECLKPTPALHAPRSSPTGSVSRRPATGPTTSVSSRPLGS